MDNHPLTRYMAHPANETCPLCIELVRQNAPLVRTPSGDYWGSQLSAVDVLVMTCAAIVIVLAGALFLAYLFTAA